jgi:hypothetical protein
MVYRLSMMNGKKGRPDLGFFGAGLGVMVCFFFGSALVESTPGCRLVQSSEKTSKSFIIVGFKVA